MAAERLLPGDLLLDHRGDERRHHDAAPADAPVRVGVPRCGQGGVVDDVEAAGVVVRAEQRGQRVQRPPGAFPQASACTVPSPGRVHTARVAGPRGVRRARQWRPAARR